jgi:hypothetical protein
MTTITIKQDIALSKTVFSSFDQAFSYLSANNFLSTPKIGRVSKKTQIEFDILPKEQHSPTIKKLIHDSKKKPISSYKNLK